MRVKLTLITAKPSKLEKTKSVLVALALSKLKFSNRTMIDLIKYSINSTWLRLNRPALRKSLLRRT